MDDETTTICPRCGHLNPPSATSCVSCRAPFSGRHLQKESQEIQEKMEKGSLQGGVAAASANEELLLDSPRRFPCPNCSHENDLAYEECARCGIIFSKYFSIKEQEFADDPEKVEAIRAQKEENLNAIAVRKQREELEKAEILRKQAFEAKKAAELRKQRTALKEAERAKLEALEQEKAEALKRQRGEAERRIATIREKAQKETVEALQRQREKVARRLELIKERTSHETAEALKKQKEEHQRKLALCREQAEQEKEDALKAQQAEFEKAENALKSEAEKEKTEALRQQEESFKSAQALKKERYEKERSQVLRMQQEDLDKNARSETIRVITELLDPRPDFKALLKKYVGQTVGIDHGAQAKIKPLVLAGVQADYLSVLDLESERFHSHPFSIVLSVVEGIGGVGDKSNTEAGVFAAVIKLLHPAR